YVGVILIRGSDTPYDYVRSAPAIDLAVRKANSEILKGSGYKLESTIMTYGPLCDGNFASGIAAEMYFRREVDAFLGPGCADALDPVGRLASYWNVPVITGSSILRHRSVGDAGRFKFKENFPTLTRLAYCQCRLRKVFGSILRQFNWTDLSLIYDTNDDYPRSLGDTLVTGLGLGGFEPVVIKFSGNSNVTFEREILEAKKYSRVSILCMSGDSIRRYLIKAYEMGLIQTGEYVFMDVELFPFPGDYWGKHHWRRGDDLDEIAKKAFEALLLVTLVEPKGQQYNEWSTRVKTRAEEVYGFNYDLNEESVNFFVGSFYDGLIHYARTVRKFIETGQNYSDGLTMSHAMWNATFEGITGSVFIDDNGDRDTSYAIRDMDPESGEFVEVAYYWGNKPGYTPDENVKMHWAGGRTAPPPNEPFCWFSGENPVCQPEGPSIVQTGDLVNILSSYQYPILLLYSHSRKYKLEAAIRDMSWLIRRLPDNAAAIELISGSTCGAFKLELEAFLAQQPNRDAVTASTNKSLNETQIFTEIGVYKGIVVAIRNINTIRPITLSRNVLLEISKRRSMNHDNVARFIGAAMEPPVIKILHDYCAKGSLQDILNNDNVTLDEDFKYSLIMDIVKGMNYIHSSDIGHHGQLRSSNCVVDSRFVLKITDFGLPSLYGTHHRNPYQDIENEHIHYERSQKADVFSFAIILEEILARGGPYEFFRGEFSPKEIVTKVKNATGLEPFRPVVSKDVCHPALHALMIQCWDEDPNKRPHFDTVKSAIRNIHGGKDRSLMESLLIRMEQYANNLEGIVAERTSLLVQEQRKTEQLLLQILPKSIAEQLKRGQSVQPETYASVTIYFSDIVGFTTISAKSSPLDVVQLLNQLYTAFDSTLEKYDVYKVETIGDAYMVVSGLPIPNGKGHAKEIALMSLALLHSIGKFRINHLPGTQLKLRIGLHSGPCVAGVVGLKMPRYCLFGDTVNTASRMESHGEALKIHVSPTTRDLLVAEDEFDLVRRGTIDVKGKGEMETFWLM
ncbi:hypothetical protein CAPTEDRAFT_22212, partial [Capitella teleta]